MPDLHTLISESLIQEPLTKEQQTWGSAVNITVKMSKDPTPTEIAQSELELKAFKFSCAVLYSMQVVSENLAIALNAYLDTTDDGEISQLTRRIRILSELLPFLERVDKSVRTTAVARDKRNSSESGSASEDERKRICKQQVNEILAMKHRENITDDDILDLIEKSNDPESVFIAWVIEYCARNVFTIPSEPSDKSSIISDDELYRRFLKLGAQVHDVFPDIIGARALLKMTILSDNMPQINRHSDEIRIAQDGFRQAAVNLAMIPERMKLPFIFQGGLHAVDTHALQNFLSKIPLLGIDTDDMEQQLSEYVDPEIFRRLQENILSNVNRYARVPNNEDLMVQGMCHSVTIDDRAYIAITVVDNGSGFTLPDGKTPAAFLQGDRTFPRGTVDPRNRDSHGEGLAGFQSDIREIGGDLIPFNLQEDNLQEILPEDVYTQVQELLSTHPFIRHTGAGYICLIPR